ncbi:MerR family transcriptional regulator [Mycobacterium marseillense]|uniref:MerR family transcriptional regulator n=1 Tax=Mycobacterium marseillense TaxID=701042 RepID=A0ABM7JDS8_9MYCO|nr:helix-turn-helix domain-containing protein [Mycobacterium marseillense]MCV7403770.1 helix-turn-helix domain-containing protein [Mycobacterium marseillense]MDM3975965.1 helix-turn-helix domain-containing protein [Mycobacterium marseillense]ORA93181.1 MerR family transcriptional regulator [Mycobacterium marseillense]BBY12102.1 MerR family transcriptional regulator [Mycobacterium marseillense]
MALRIGELAEATGTTAPTIRYYEQIGLLPNPRRVGGQRRYEEDDVRRVTFIRRCRDLDFSVEHVRSLVELTHDRDRSCFEARDLALLHLTAVRAKLAQLRTLESRIVELIATSELDCGGARAADCVVLDRLSGPAQLPRP